MKLRNWQRLLAPDPTVPITPGPGTAAAVPAPAPAPAPDPAPAPAAPQILGTPPPAVVAPAADVVSRKDFEDFKATVAKLVADSKAPAPVSTPTSEAAALAASMRRMMLDGALDKAGVTNPSLRVLISGNAPAGMDADAIAAHVATYAALGRPAPAAAAPPAAPPPAPPAHQGKSDLGAPGAAPGDLLPDDPTKWTRDQSWALFRKDPRELRRRVEAWAWKGSMSNPYAMRRGN